MSNRARRRARKCRTATAKSRSALSPSQEVGTDVGDGGKGFERDAPALAFGAEAWTEGLPVRHGGCPSGQQFRRRARSRAGRGHPATNARLSSQFCNLNNEVVAENAQSGDPEVRTGVNLEPQAGTNGQPGGAVPLHPRQLSLPARWRMLHRGLEIPAEALVVDAVSRRFGKLGQLFRPNRAPDGSAVLALRPDRSCVFFDDADGRLCEYPPRPRRRAPAERLPALSARGPERSPRYVRHALALLPHGGLAARLE